MEQRSVDDSIDGADPFGLNRRLGERRRKVPPSLQTCMTPQKTLIGDVKTNNGKNGTIPRKHRSTLETASVSLTEESLLASPTTNQSQQQESPASNWNVSRISTKDAVSISPLEIDQRFITNLVDGRRHSSVNSSLPSQIMQKQLLQLVNSLQSNLDENQEVRDSQLRDIKRLDQTIQALQRQVNDLQNEKTFIEQQREQEGIALRKEFEKSQAENRGKNDEIEELQRQLRHSERNAEENQTALQNIQVEHSALAQSLAEQVKAKDHLKVAHEKLQEEKRIIDQQSQELIREQKRWQQEHKSLREEITELESAKAKVRHDEDLLKKERSQVQALQQQFVEMQNTQVALEKKQNEEEDRLIKFSSRMDQRAQELENQRREIINDENKLDVLHQKIMNQQVELEKGQATLKTEKRKFELKLEQMADLEIKLQSKAEELKQEETILSQEKDELEQLSKVGEAKHALALQALEEVAAKRIDEESRMKTALQNLDEIEEKYMRIKNELKKTEDILMAKQNIEREKLDDIQIKVEAEKNKLEEIIKNAESARHLSDQERHEAKLQIDDLTDELDTLQNSIEQDEIRKEEILEEIASQEAELETLLNYIQSERAAWEEEKKSATIKHEDRTKQKREIADGEIRNCRERAQKEINLMVESAVARQEIISSELIEQINQMEAMQNDIEKAGRQWSSKYEKLNTDQREYVQKRFRLDQLVLELKGAREDAKLRDENIELERKRLHDLLDRERKKHHEIILSIQEESDIYLEGLRQEHRDELKDQRSLFDSVRCELEDRNKEIQRQMLEHQIEEEKKLTKLQDEKTKIESEVVVARRTIAVSQKELKMAQQQISDLSKVESLEREKMHSLMERFECSNARLEVKENTLAGREKELEELREQNNKQMNLMEESKRKMEERLRQLQEKEIELRKCNTDLEDKKVEVGEQILKSRKVLRTVALRNLVNKSWREDKELVSAAFSKWLRVTMVESNAEKRVLDESVKEELNSRLADLDHESQVKEEKISILTAELNDIKSELAAAKENNSKTVNSTDNLKADLVSKKEALARAEAQLKKKDEDYNAEKLLLTQLIEADKAKVLIEQTKLSEQRRQLGLDQAALAEEKERIERKKQEGGESVQGILEQRKMVDETAKKLILKDREISAKTERIREAEKRVQEQEDKVFNEAAEFRQAQLRVRKLAEQLQEREKLIEDRERDIEKSQNRVLIMAQKLQEKEQALQAQNRQLDSRMQDLSYIDNS
eukprot:CAMPEP_0194218096 /NCGR_PEP_ID=MMETSP0156-20130528/23012_1 /TAXON_ID=33649 /ORGANISM="Thalassionema nitzschioides, Strain L26-B" /LENGTH=1245 /DNA_ID=CAMNT_0038947333 /DNA_START=56 /DNA_END=3793 /DNA_ORIENTATION=+